MGRLSGAVNLGQFWEDFPGIVEETLKVFTGMMWSIYEMIHI